MSNVKNKINVLLIGDSIRMNYQGHVARLLGEDYCVWGSEDNGRFAKFTLVDIRRQLELWGKIPHIIHWNNGLWDTAVSFEEDGIFTPPEEYRRDMSHILREIKKITPYVIFATTTPVASGNCNHSNKIIEEYNSIALDVIKGQNVAVNDLYMLVKGYEKEYICSDTVHLSEPGKEICAAAVANCVKAIKMQQ